MKALKLSQRLALMPALLIGLGLFSAQASASNGFNSEASHAAGGAAMAGALVWASDAWTPQYDRAWVGFSVSAAIGILVQYHEYDKGTNTASEALLDAASHTLGAAIGAYVTDGYLLSPVVKPEPGGSYVGVDLSFRF
ncbi:MULTISPECIES: hypothetical protein [Shewanella]|uniref:hypothetical protein n=1 Tax=Shewanella TaxID=22 RepID=UPI001C65E434|nr:MULTISPECIES: hypothetical protein [Shewanella]QYJ82910.1 hypothetical protein K0H80_02460 [Shewanella aegiceratis]QYJ94282.1 hypothetical protein K0I31_02475 [Shewanella spartinae]